jgi:hypothetical protein
VFRGLALLRIDLRYGNSPVAGWTCRNLPAQVHHFVLRHAAYAAQHDAPGTASSCLRKTVSTIEPEQGFQTALGTIKSLYDAQPITCAVWDNMAEGNAPTWAKTHKDTTFLCHGIMNRATSVD